MENTLMIIPRTFPFLLLVLLFSTTAWANKPNMIFIIADDCTFRDIGCYGGRAKTPHIDKLATEGMRFTMFSGCTHVFTHASQYLYWALPG